MIMEIMKNWSELELPGFRFHPTEEELLDFYLKRAVRGKKLQPEIIRTLNIYRYHPMELPGMARSNNGEREWYFFVPRDRRSNNGGRPSRTTDKGFWKATGSDRTIRSASDPKRKIGMKKTLVFYEGRAPRGTRTDWVMNEYRLPAEPDNTAADVAVADTSCAFLPPKEEDIVLCKIYRKATSMKELEQRAAVDHKDAGAPQYNYGGGSHGSVAADNTSASFSSSSDQKTTSLHKSPTLPLMWTDQWTDVQTKETEAEVTSLAAVGSGATLMRATPAPDMLQVPPRQEFDWAHDPFLAQLRSPWLDYWSPLYANILNF